MRLLKNILLLVFILCHANVSLAQLKFYKSYDKALNAAKVKQLPLFISIDFETGSNSLPLVKVYALEPGVSEYYNSKFINYRVEQHSPEGLKLTEQYGLKTFPAYLFLKPDGGLILKSRQFPRNKNFFLAMAEEAAERFKVNMGLADYDKRYQEKSNITREFLRDYITLRKNSGFFDNAELIERYIDFLTIRELNNYNEVVFIHEAGPIAFGRAYNFAGSNRKAVDSLFTYAPVQDRIDINDRIIDNTFAQAIKTKDQGMANALSSFVSNTWKTNYKEGGKQSGRYMIAFFKATKNTDAFYNQSMYYYDEHFMLVSADSVKNILSGNKRKSDSLKANIDKISKKNTSTMIFSMTSLGGTNNWDITNTAGILNNAAWDFYTFGTRNEVMLGKAMQWCRRSIEIDPRATYFDTLAHLMYRLGWHDEAIMNEEKAIRLAIEQKQLSADQIKGFRKEVEKMKSRTL